MIHRLISYDRVTLSTRQLKVSEKYDEILIALAQSAIHWTRNGWHVVFVDNGIRLLDHTGKVVRTVKMESEER